MVSLVASDDTGLSGTTVRLPVSGFAPTHASDGAQIQGVLRLDEDHCVYLEAGQDGADPGRIVRRVAGRLPGHREGTRLTIYDADRAEVAHDGDQVRTGGGYAAGGHVRG